MSCSTDTETRRIKVPCASEEFESSWRNVTADVAHNDERWSLTADGDQPRPLAISQRSPSMIATLDDKGHHCQQIAGRQLVVASGQHRVSGCFRSTSDNDA